MLNEPIHHVWQAMSEHFLDTETRHLIPHTAWICHEYVMTVEEIEQVWMHDVTPALFWNLYDIAGEWAGWSLPWLCERIERKRRQRLRSTRLGRWLYDIQIGGDNTYLKAILACRTLYKDGQTTQHQPLKDALSWLARVYFDMDSFQKLSAPASKETLTALFHRTFLPIFEPLTYTAGDREANRQRVLSRIDGIDENSIATQNTKNSAPNETLAPP